VTFKLLAVADYETFGGACVNVAVGAAAKASMIWLRMKNMDANLIYEEARKLRKAVQGLPLILSERPDIAEAAGFDGVQLNARTLPPEEAKRVFPKLITGYSAHSVREIECVRADYFTLSPLFLTNKPYDVKPLGAVDVSYLNKVVYALGGMNSETVHFIENKGYEGYACIRCLLD
jgi:thiamine-phosphate pyrophosphorylase